MEGGQAGQSGGGGAAVASRKGQDKGMPGLQWRRVLADQRLGNWPEAVSQ